MSPRPLDRLLQHSEAISQVTDPIPWLAAALRGECPLWPFGAKSPDVECLMQGAQAQGVGGLLLAGLSRCACAPGPPAALLKALTHRDRMDRAVELNREIELTRVLALLVAADLHPLIMKGTALAYGLYRHPHWRSRCDTDLLFADRASADRAWVLLETGGYHSNNAVSGEWISREFACYRTDRVGVSHALDIHWGLSNTQVFNNRLSYAELDLEARPIPALGPHARGLSPVHALLLACMHRLAHVREGQSHRLIWLYDIHLLTTAFTDADTDADWGRCADLATNRGVVAARIRAVGEQDGVPIQRGGGLLVSDELVDHPGELIRRGRGQATDGQVAQAATSNSRGPKPCVPSSIWVCHSNTTWPACTWAAKDSTKA